ncbi:cell wall hydrolase [Kaistia dalseonensis]|uniref:Spore germination cell wall hydrolase CwlJ-like protein n=1 Tax=Kaistia dalseonensis TaxID=410840 RepID=A0ABU0HF78_9HYPH|nr:cell wall hydrolase [Kaistia dalseonensis]MCX5497505.1 cell wall hydrolase [Kaistia dalseonensis]MDQ0440144.1 spore germination cell wall hydrolase CwlJ-like protein [Kaistia dalseonensis]
MVGLVQHSQGRVVVSRVGQGRDPRRTLRRRPPRPAHGRIALLSGLLAIGFLSVSSTSIAFQDVASLFGKDLPLSQRWLARLVPTPSGEAYLPTLVTPARPAPVFAESDGIIVRPVLDMVRTGMVSAPEFVPPRVNRDAKGDIEISRPKQVARTRFTAGVLQTSARAEIYGPAASAPAMAFLAPHDVGKAMVAAADPAPVPAKVAKPAVTLANIAPLPRPKAKGAKGADTDLVVSAYANADDNSAINAPFNAVLNKPMAVGIDGKPDHWWVTNPIPPNARSKTEQKCLATAIYFEARGESEKGELAVAQVVINRLKNPAYPKTICGVVYQNKDMRNACQFSFACDGIKDRITDEASWARAQALAKEVVYQDNWWNPNVGSATHYHANYVKPRWARTMKKMQKIGHHIFYKTYGGGWS